MDDDRPRLPGPPAGRFGSQDLRDVPAPLRSPATRRSRLAKDCLPAPLNDFALAGTWAWAWLELDRSVPFVLRLDLQRAWSEPGRHRHAFRHLRECLALWCLWKVRFDRPAEAALALWLHGVVYVPGATDNEARSADWAARALGGAGAPSEVIACVRMLVLATHLADQRSEPDGQLLVDIDLAVLGAPQARFEIYERDAREEHALLADAAYRECRLEELQGLTERPSVYRTDVARQMLEEQARANLRHAIEQLSPREVDRAKSAHTPGAIFFEAP